MAKTEDPKFSDPKSPKAILATPKSEATPPPLATGPLAAFGQLGSIACDLNRDDLVAIAEARFDTELRTEIANLTAKRNAALADNTAKERAIDAERERLAKSAFDLTALTHFIVTATAFYNDHGTTPALVRSPLTFDLCMNEEAQTLEASANCAVFTQALHQSLIYSEGKVLRQLEKELAEGVLRAEELAKAIQAARVRHSQLPHLRVHLRAALASQALKASPGGAEIEALLKGISVPGLTHDVAGQG